MDYPNAVDTVERTTVLEEAANCAPVITPLVSKWYCTRPTDPLFRSDSGVTRAIYFASKVQEGGAMRPATLCLALLAIEDENIQGRFRARRSASLLFRAWMGGTPSCLKSSLNVLILDRKQRQAKRCRPHSPSLLDLAGEIYCPGHSRVRPKQSVRWSCVIPLGH